MSESMETTLCGVGNCWWECYQYACQTDSLLGLRDSQI